MEINKPNYLKKITLDDMRIFINIKIKDLLKHQDEKLKEYSENYNEERIELFEKYKHNKCLLDKYFNALDKKYEILRNLLYEENNILIKKLKIINQTTLENLKQIAKIKF